MTHKTQDSTYIMTRPAVPGQGLIVENMASAKEKRDLFNLYERAFLKYILNIKGTLSDEQHEMILGSILPTVSLVMFHEEQEAMEQLRVKFLNKANPEQLKAFESFADQESSFAFVLNIYLNQFINEVLLKGMDVAKETFSLFYNAFRSIYFDLPQAHIFHLIDISEK